MPYLFISVYGQRVKVLSKRPREHSGVLWYQNDAVPERAQWNARDVLAVNQDAASIDSGGTGAGQ